MTIPNVIPLQRPDLMMNEYVAHGFALCPIPPGSKGPNTQGWNSLDNAVTKPDVIPFGHGCGLLHSFSGTMALDVDNMDHAEMLLACHGINLQDLLNAPDAVQVISGRAGHGKLIYKMPSGLVLPSKQVKLIGVALEMRCATANGLSVQDILPPSIHPDTKQAYTWGGAGDWRKLPMIPEALLKVWEGLVAKDARRTIHTGAPISASWQEVRGALEYISPDCTHDEWRDVGFALHYSGTQTNQLEEAFQLWHEWSAKATVKGKYLGESYMRGRWNTFVTTKDSPVTLGTLMKLAKENGWERPAPDVSDLFKPTSDPSSPVPDALPPLVDPRSADVVIPVDMSLLPKVLAQRALEIGKSVGCDPAVPMWAGLGVVSAAVDHRTTLKLAHGFTVKPILWLMTIGAPSDKKTPGATPMKMILKQIEDEDYPRYQRDLKIWETREAIALAAKKRYHTAKSSPEASLDAVGGIDSMTFDDLPPELSLPPRPYQLQMEVSDITSQKLARTCHEQPRGVLCYLDEMRQWMAKLSDPKSGENRSTWVQAFEGASYKVDRVADGAIHVENLSVAVYGNVQPKVFKEYAKQLMSDGLLQRFLYVKLDPDKTSVGEPSPDNDTTLHQWEQSIRLLAALPATQYTLSEGAYRVFRQFQQYMDEVRKRERLLQSSEVYQEAISKQVGQCGRIALVWHLLESPWQTELSEELMVRVIRFVRSTVIPTMRQVLDVSLSESTLDNWIKDHILTRADRSSVTLPELRKGAHYQLQAMTKWESESAIMDVMSDLERVQWVARMDDGSKTSTITWAINPRLSTQFQDQRAAVIAARQARRMEMYDDYMRINPEYRPKPVYGQDE